jgi:hypothetical protein
MSDEERALVPVDQRTIDFYGDELTAAIIEKDGQQTVYVAVRPICDYLGVSWQGQHRRILDDEVLSEVVMSVNITLTDIEPGSRRPKTSQMLCLPVDYVNGFLFGINAKRVKEDVRARLLRYQRECYQILAEAFLDRRVASEESPAVQALIQIKEMGLAIAQMAEQQIEVERRLATTEDRLDKAAVFVGSLGKRLTAVERQIRSGSLTKEQAREIKRRVNKLALLLTEQRPGEKHFQGIYAALEDQTGVTSYTSIPPAAFEAAVEWLDNWIRAIQRGAVKGEE